MSFLIKNANFCNFVYIFLSFSGAEKWNAVIIGAGFSGLDMGIKLKEIGVNFTILEKSSNLG